MTPRATYRLQLRNGVDFDRAAALAPYLARLGVSHLYASPIFAAAPGSTHGYDVTDHNRLEPALGGRAGFDRLSDALKAEGLGLIVDIVPNHMAASPHNGWWRDVLRFGRASGFAGHFDIDWSAPELVLATLGRPYGEALEAGELGLARDGEGLNLTYYEHAFPLCPESWPAVLEDLPADADGLGRWLADGANADRLDRRLADLAEDRQALHAIHERQHWRLAHWRLARDGLTYRRFFEIADLVGVRVDQEAVFDDVHRLTFELLEAGRIDGLRIDHVDGLADPAGYLARLRERAPGNPPIWVEKILGRDEGLPGHWPVEGTTGYEFANAVHALLTDPAGLAALRAHYDAFTGTGHDPGAMLAEAKHEILTRNLAAELGRLSALAGRIAARDMRGRDLGPDTIRRALIAIASAMPVYRSYLSDPHASEANDRLLDAVAAEAARHGGLEQDDAIATLMALIRTDRSDEGALLRTRFEQTTGALMAKALEDTLFYRHTRLVSANEVGAEAEPETLAPSGFHAAIAARAASQPNPLNATASHDTKRGEDARMRIAAIAGDAAGWAAAVERWDGLLDAAGPSAPDAEARWLFYQALLGAWQDGPGAALGERLSAYMVKAAREAKRRTTWTRPDTGYEESLTRFVATALGDRRFLADFSATVGPLIAAGARKSLVQLALKLTLPGVPDIYQGTEWADLSLVDPDNRRPVDFAAREAPPDEADATGPTPFDRDKAMLMRRLLDLRRRAPDLMAGGAYLPLAPVDPAATHEAAIAFARTRGEEAVLVIAETDPGAAGEALWFALPPGLPRIDPVDILGGAPLARDAGRIGLPGGFGALPVIVACDRGLA